MKFPLKRINDNSASPIDLKVATSSSSLPLKNGSSSSGGVNGDIKGSSSLDERSKVRRNLDQSRVPLHDGGYIVGKVQVLVPTVFPQVQWRIKLGNNKHSYLDTRLYNQIFMYMHT